MPSGGLGRKDDVVDSSAFGEEGLEKAERATRMPELASERHDLEEKRTCGELGTAVAPVIDLG